MIRRSWLLIFILVGPWLAVRAIISAAIPMHSRQQLMETIGGVL
jgi:hypothetical protein